MSQLPLRPEVFAILSGLIEERSGMHYAPDDRALLADRVSSRALDAGFESLLDYYYFLRYDDPSGAEFDALLDALVVNETYFFRELDQLEAVVDGLLVPLAQAGSRPRFWSAACSTGEEPLTVAMLLAERGLLGQVELVASDVSHRALARARSGAFGPRALRQGAPPSLTRRWLEGEPGGPLRARPELAATIDWRRVNLTNAAQVAAIGPCDVIACRNVLIYFREATIRRVIGSLASALRPNGALVVGVSESLLRLGLDLHCEERKGAFFYRKAGPP
ncbi:MAG: protein-glutamate O-methyltransferase CheR [Polyangiaceae bacterium]|jgi:chemotaxis protein methyltransferase CheR|nr:protein-glutamate O-methyltransferase CheR [Polyangiaceae bacterium]